LVFKLPDYF